MRVSRLRILVMLCAFGLLGFSGWWWTRQQHRPPDALAAVQGYLRQEASAISAANPHALANCRRASAFEPFQTNGNRLRRRLQGLSPDAKNISIEFSDCLVRFYLRRPSDGEAWQVYRVQQHAG